MTLIIDTSAVLALANVRDADHEAVRRVRREERGPIVMPAPITTEAEYMLRTRIGHAVADRFLRDLSGGGLHIACLEDHEYEAIAQLNARYADLHLGLADLSIVVIARRFETRRLLTFDARHFRAIEPLQGGSFTLLPADA